MLAVGFFFSAIAEETSNKHLDWFSLSSHQLISSEQNTAKYFVSKREFTYCFVGNGAKSSTRSHADSDWNELLAVFCRRGHTSFASHCIIVFHAFLRKGGGFILQQRFDEETLSFSLQKESLRTQRWEDGEREGWKRRK